MIAASQFYKNLDHHNSKKDALTMASGNHMGTFEEKSQLDQDDSYGNYKPKFRTKKYKVIHQALIYN